MSPKVEFLQKPDQMETEYFVVDLNSPEAFNRQRFDEQADELRANQDMKFIVLKDRMFVFPFWQYHVEFISHVNESDPQYAGTISIRIRPNGQRERKIHEYSSSLEKAGLLTQIQSEEYKHTILAEKLGEHFKIR